MQSQVDSLLPLLFLDTGNLQLAVDEAVSMLEDCIRQFEHAGNELRNKYSQDDVTNEGIEAFIRGCQYACTGNLNWR